MKFYRISAISLLLTVCVACATNTSETSNVAKVASSDTESVLVSKEVRLLAKTDISNKELGDQLVCTKVQKVGTKFSTKVCRTKTEVKLERERAQETMERARRTISGSGG